MWSRPRPLTAAPSYTCTHRRDDTRTARTTRHALLRAKSPSQVTRQVQSLKALRGTKDLAPPAPPALDLTPDLSRQGHHRGSGVQDRVYKSRGKIAVPVDTFTGSTSFSKECFFTHTSLMSVVVNIGVQGLESETCQPTRCRSPSRRFIGT